MTLGAEVGMGVVEEDGPAWSAECMSFVLTRGSAKRAFCLRILRPPGLAMIGIKARLVVSEIGMIGRNKGISLEEKVERADQMK